MQQKQMNKSSLQYKIEHKYYCGYNKMQEQQQLEQKNSNEIKDENVNEVKNRQYKIRLQTNEMKMLFNQTNFQHFNIEQFKACQLFQLQSFRNLYYKLSFWLKYRNKQGAKWNNRQLGYLFSTIFQQLKRISVLPIQDATKQLQKIIQLYKTDNIFKTKSLYQLKMPKPQLNAQKEAENQYQKRIQMDYNLPDKPRITFRRGSKIIRNVRSHSLVSTAQIVFCSKLQSLNMFTESKQIKDFMFEAQKNKARVRAQNTLLYRHQTLKTKPLSLFVNQNRLELTQSNETMTRQTEVTVQNNERKLRQKKRALSEINGINLIKPSDLIRGTRSKSSKKLKLKSSKSVSPKKKKKKLKLKLKQKKEKEKLII